LKNQWLVGENYKPLSTYWAWIDSEEMAEFLGLKLQPDAKLIKSILGDLTNDIEKKNGHLPPDVDVEVPGILYGRLAELNEPRPEQMLSRRPDGTWRLTDPLELVLFGKLHEKLNSNQLILSVATFRRAIQRNWGIQRGDDHTGEAGGGFRLLEKAPKPAAKDCDKHKLFELLGLELLGSDLLRWTHLNSLEILIPKKGKPLLIWNRYWQEYQPSDYASYKNKEGALEIWVAESTPMDVLVDRIVEDDLLDADCPRQEREDFRIWWREFTAPPPLDPNATDAEKISRLISSNKSARDIIQTGLKGSQKDEWESRAHSETIRRLWPIIDEIWKQQDEDPAGARLRAIQQILYYHGDATLSVLKDLIPNAPKQWAGGAKTREFCRRHGLSDKFSGVSKSGREPELRIDPPPHPWPPLHDYQEAIVQEMTKVLEGKLLTKAGPRAMVSLPTGTGKTRVAIESVIRAFAQKEESPAAPLIWMAPSDELCEQAVQAVHACWRGLNPRLGLVLNRLWSTNSIDPLKDEDRLAYFQFVVATPEKLRKVLPNSSDLHHTNSWLARPAAVIVDEAHYSISAEFTDILERLGIEQNQKTNCPLIGLSATPYRQNEEDARWLANRYGGRKLTVSQFEGNPEGLYRHLQNRGILAHADYEELQGLTDHSLPQKLAEQLVPTFSGYTTAFYAETLLNNYLDTSRERLETILKRCLEFDKDWKVVVFAPSVCSAEVLAARLNEEGRPARAISGNTKPGFRRQAIKDFQHEDNRLQFLINYGVLSAGFDAPKARAVVVGRYVQSPVTYFQIIGRGLRGPANGGTDRCLIVNVKDTFRNFGRRLAYQELDWIWEAHR
jgi:superfamily II DNA or RNA helicase